MTGSPETKVNEFREKIDFVEKNELVETEGRQIRIKDYFKELLHVDKLNFYYVLASEIVEVTNSLVDLTRNSDYSFDIWRCQLVPNGIRIQRIPIPSRGGDRRNISSLTAYLEKTHPSAGNTIQICLSSNKCYLVFQSCISLRSLDSFTYNDFLSSFSIDLKDYHEFEKRFLFESFINFGIECNLIKILDDRSDIFDSSYVIVNRNRHFPDFKDSIVSKMAEHKMKSNPEILKRIENEKEEIVRRVYEKKYKQKSLLGYV